MRRLLLGLMAANLTGSEANRLLDAFYSMDSDFSGTIELQELGKVAKQVRKSDEEGVNSGDEEEGERAEVVWSDAHWVVKFVTSEAPPLPGDE
jgi:hypothetical protein